MLLLSAEEASTVSAAGYGSTHPTHRAADGGVGDIDVDAMAAAAAPPAGETLAPAASGAGRRSS